MEPEDNNNHNQHHKNQQAPLTRQINQYRHSLPEVAREEGHFFFKEVSRQMEGISFVTIGYRVSRIPFQLQDLVAVIINSIHCYCDLNLKIILDQHDNLWVTGSIGHSNQQANSLNYRIQEAHLNESLRKTQRILAQFLQEIHKNYPKEEDKLILQRLNKEIIKMIQNVFRNPDLED